MSEQSPQREHLDPLPQGRRMGVRKQLTPGDMTLRNIVWALGMTIAVVVVAAITVLGVGRDPVQEIPETSRLDVAASAERAQQEAPFPVTVPALADTWSARDARFQGAEAPTWQVRYSSPSGDLVTVMQTAELGTSEISQTLPGFTVEGEVSLGGASCQQLTVREGDGDDADTRRGYACTGGAGDQSWGLLVHGAASDAELREVTEAAVTDIADRAAQDG